MSIPIILLLLLVNHVLCLQSPIRHKEWRSGSGLKVKRIEFPLAASSPWRLCEQSHTIVVNMSPTAFADNRVARSSMFARVVGQRSSKATCRRFASSDEAPSQKSDEETLLRLNLSVAPDADPQDALAAVQSYAQSFPFAAVLPVQPLQYLPTHDGGVDVVFLRKKTKEKGSVDGGIRFFVNFSDGEEEGTSTGEMIHVVAKRNSSGQTVSKFFSEKLVVQAFVGGISGEKEEWKGDTLGDVVSVESVFHKWM